MTLRELIELLNEAATELPDDDDPEVLFAYQPSYPLQDEIGGVRVFRPDPESRQPAPVVYLVTGGQCEQPYAPDEVFGRGSEK